MRRGPGYRDGSRVGKSELVAESSGRVRPVPGGSMAAVLTRDIVKKGARGAG